MSPINLAQDPIQKSRQEEEQELATQLPSKPNRVSMALAASAISSMNAQKAPSDHTKHHTPTKPSFIFHKIWMEMGGWPRDTKETQQKEPQVRVQLRKASGSLSAFWAFGAVEWHMRVRVR
jgi:hypothetical protein